MRKEIRFVKRCGIIITCILIIYLSLRNYLLHTKISTSQNNQKHLNLYNDGNNYYHLLAEEMNVHNKYVIFIIINSRDPSSIPIWLEDCKPPLCSYQVFGDYHVNSTNLSNSTNSTVVYPEFTRNATGYSNFGHRGKFQMEWAITHRQFDWLVKVDDDGYLCVDSLLHSLLDRNHAPPKEKFIFGRFHCDARKAKPDENFYVMSFDVVQYFVHGWNKFLVRFDGRITLGLNIGTQLSHLHNKCGWEFWSDRHRLQWKEPNDFDCNKYIWIHHVNSTRIQQFHEYHKTHPCNVTLFQSNGIVSVNSTGCGLEGLEKGLPRFRKSILKKLRVLTGDSKYESKNEKIAVDFSKSVRPPCYV